MSTDNTKEAMPFNDHTPLPWEVNPHGPVICHRDLNEQGLRRTRWVAEVNNQQDSQADAAFIVHACNTYYEREQARQRDKERIEEFAWLVQELVNALRTEYRYAVQLKSGDEDGGIEVEKGTFAALSKAKQLGFTPTTQ